MITRAKTNYGIVEGVTSNQGYGLFRGVPYAAPPVGELRWRPPQDPEPWEGGAPLRHLRPRLRAV